MKFTFSQQSKDRAMCILIDKDWDMWNLTNFHRSFFKMFIISSLIPGDAAALSVFIDEAAQESWRSPEPLSSRSLRVLTKNERNLDNHSVSFPSKRASSKALSYIVVSQYTNHQFNLPKLFPDYLFIIHVPTCYSTYHVAGCCSD